MVHLYNGTLFKHYNGNGKQIYKRRKMFPIYETGKNLEFVKIILLCKLIIYTLEKEMATHSNVLAWEIPWTEELGWL